MLNITIFQGRIVNDIILEHTKGSNIPLCRLRVAVERDCLVGGERKTDFIPCVAWRDTAVFATKYFSKGDVLTVRGRLEEDVWTDTEGNKRSRIIVQAETLYFGETKRAREERQQRRAGNAELPPLPDDEDVPPEFYDDAQLPF